VQLGALKLQIGAGKPLPGSIECVPSHLLGLKAPCGYRLTTGLKQQRRLAATPSPRIGVPGAAAISNRSLIILLGPPWPNSPHRHQAPFFTGGMKGRRLVGGRPVSRSWLRHLQDPGLLGESSEVRKTSWGLVRWVGKHRAMAFSSFEQSWAKLLGDELPSVLQLALIIARGLGLVRQVVAADIVNIIQTVQPITDVRCYAVT
jgi:hypothetical protein